DIQKSLHNHQMNYYISSDNHKGIIAINDHSFFCGLKHEFAKISGVLSPRTVMVVLLRAYEKYAGGALQALV
ncbi:hypothetical protein, partial [Lapidilactobacillus bayanensis]|uniref:hypothetical protein n=1 Tax=Lapidilactobacillus bayanensis TaxID=2485998 RepID=UPI001CDCC68B